MRVPLTIIAGFLGSGKTSLLQNILVKNKSKRITALVNDFGALNIDAELIAEQDATQITLANGCVCCSINDDLARGLAASLASSPAPDHIIIEASGVADPARVALFAAVDKALRLDGIICLIDVAAHNKHTSDKYLADTYARQLASADLFLLNKIDLVDEQQLASVQNDLHKTREQVPQIICEQGRVASDIILGVAAEESYNLSPAPLAENHGLKSWSAHLPSLCRNECEQKLQSLAPALVRAKGVLRDAQGAYTIHYVGGRIDIASYSDKPSGNFTLIGKPDLPDDATLAKLFAE